MYSSLGWIKEYSAALWDQVFKLPIDSRPDMSVAILQEIRDYFFRESLSWQARYDFLEWTLSQRVSPSVNSVRLVAAINAVLERELSGFRYVGGAHDSTSTDRAGCHMGAPGLIPKGQGDASISR